MTFFFIERSGGRSCKIRSRESWNFSDTGHHGCHGCQWEYGCPFSTLRIWDFYIGKRQSKSREEKELPEAQATVAAMIRPSDPLTPITFDFSLSNRQSGNLGTGPGPKRLESEHQSVHKTTSVILYLLTGQGQPKSWLTDSVRNRGCIEQPRTTH